jgi:glycosyltransferase involved in cell wall biosynthesis
VRVLLTTDFFAPHLGGVELQVQALARSLLDQGHDVVVATVAQPGTASRDIVGAVPVRRLRALTTAVPWLSRDRRRRYHPPFPDPVLALLLRRLVRSFRPDVVQCHGWIAYSTAMALLGTGIPLVLSVRDYGYACATRNLLLRGRVCTGPELGKCLRHATSVYGLAKGASSVASVLGLRRWLVSRTAVAHSVSTYVGNEVRRDLARDAPLPVVTIADIVLREPDEPDEPRDRTLPTRPYILFVGALQPHKGIHVLLDAYGRLDEAPPLVLIGTRWPDSPARYPAGVIVVTDAPHSVVMDAWSGALFGVAPSIWPDPLPGVVREAMSRGRPVIGSRVGGITDIIEHERNGLLVTPGDARELAAAMLTLLRDETLRHRLGDQARVDAAGYTPAAIGSAFRDLYSEVLAAPSRDAAPATLPDRVFITGGSGAGKTTLAQRVAALFGLPLHHLDEIARDPVTRQPRSIPDRLAIIHSIASSPMWVTEGVQSGWTQELCERADVIIWLDHLAAPLASMRVVSRFVAGGWRELRRQRGWRRFVRLRSWALHTFELVTALGEIRRFHRDGRGDAADAGSRAATATQLAAFEDKVVHCRRPADVERLVVRLEQLARRRAASGGAR